MEDGANLVPLGFTNEPHPFVFVVVVMFVCFWWGAGGRVSSYMATKVD